MKTFIVGILLTTVLASHVQSMDRYDFPVQRPGVNNAPNNRLPSPPSRTPSNQRPKPTSSNISNLKKPSSQSFPGPYSMISNIGNMIPKSPVNPSMVTQIPSQLAAAPASMMSQTPSQLAGASASMLSQIPSHLAAVPGKIAQAAVNAPTALGYGLMASNPLGASAIGAQLMSPIIVNIMNAIRPELLQKAKTAAIGTVNNGVQALKLAIEALLRMLNDIQTSISQSIGTFGRYNGNNWFAAAINNFKFNLGTRINGAIDRIRPLLQNGLGRVKELAMTLNMYNNMPSIPDESKISEPIINENELDSNVNRNNRSIWGDSPETEGESDGDYSDEEDEEEEEEEDDDDAPLDDNGEESETSLEDYLHELQK